jgi:uncharacterized protein YdbL (DUF1318 family)
MLRVTYSRKEAKKALEIAKKVPHGINIDTPDGYLSLYGDDAQQVMELVAEIAARRASTAKHP